VPNARRRLRILDAKREDVACIALVIMACVDVQHKDNHTYGYVTWPFTDWLQTWAEIIMDVFRSS
jgi:hypothetical protein